MRGSLIKAGVVSALFIANYAVPSVAEPLKEDVHTAVYSELAKFGVSFLKFSYDATSPSPKVASGLDAIGSQDASRAARSMAESYRSKLAQANAAADLTKSIGDVVINTSSVAATATGIGAVPVALLSSAASWGNERLASLVRESGTSSARALLAQGLNQWDSRSGITYDDVVRMMKEGKTKDAAEAFDNATGFLRQLRSQLADDPEASELAEKRLFETMTGTQKATLEAIAAEKHRVDDLTGQVADNTRFSLRLAAEIRGDIDKYQSALGDLKTQVDRANGGIRQLAEQQNATALQLEAVRTVLYDQQSPRGKLLLLKSGSIAGINEKQRGALIDYYEGQAKLQTITDQSNLVLQYASGAQEILSNLGVRDKNLDAAVKYGSIEVNAFASFASGNYIGMAVQISGIFGGGSNDNQLSNISILLNSIKAKLDDVERLQRETLRSIEELSRQLSLYEHHLDERLDRLDFGIANIGEGIRALLWQKFGSCNSAYLARDVAGRARFDDQTLSYLTVNDFYLFMTSNSANVIDCGRKLSETFNAAKRIGTFGQPLSLRLAPAGASQQELADFLAKVYQPSLVALVQFWPEKWGNRALALSSLGSPARDVRGLLQRETEFNRLTTPRACTAPSHLSQRLRSLLCVTDQVYAPREAPSQEDTAKEAAASREFDSLMGDPLATEQFDDLVKWTALSARALDVWDGRSDANYLLVRDIEAGQGVARGKDLLWTALELIDVAISQQGLSGDLNALNIYSNAWDMTNGGIKSDLPVNIRNLLSNRAYPLLGKNVLMIALCRQAQLLGIDAYVPYQVLYEQMSAAAGSNINAEKASYRSAADGFRTLFHLPDSVKFDVEFNNGLALIRADFDGTQIEMPTPENFRTGRLFYYPSLDGLIRLRGVLAERFVDYELLQDVNTDQNALIMAKMVYATSH